MADPAHSDAASLAQEKLSAISLLGFLPDIGIGPSTAASPGAYEPSVSGSNHQQNALSNGAQPSRRVSSHAQQQQDIFSSLSKEASGSGTLSVGDCAQGAQGAEDSSDDGLDFLDIVDVPSVLATITGQALKAGSSYGHVPTASTPIQFRTSVEQQQRQQLPSAFSFKDSISGEMQPASHGQSLGPRPRSSPSASGVPSSWPLMTHGSPSRLAPPGSPAQRMLALGRQALQATVGALPGRLSLQLPGPLGSLLGMSRSGSTDSNQPLPASPTGAQAAVATLPGRGEDGACSYGGEGSIYLPVGMFSQNGQRSSTDSYTTAGFPASGTASKSASYAQLTKGEASCNDMDAPLDQLAMHMQHISTRMPYGSPCTPSRSSKGSLLGFSLSFKRSSGQQQQQGARASTDQPTSPVSPAGVRVSGSSPDPPFRMQLPSQRELHAVAHALALLEVHEDTLQALSGTNSIPPPAHATVSISASPSWHSTNNGSAHGGSTHGGWHYDNGGSAHVRGSTEGDASTAKAVHGMHMTEANLHAVGSRTISEGGACSSGALAKSCNMPMPPSNNHPTMSNLQADANNAFMGFFPPASPRGSACAGDVPGFTASINALLGGPPASASPTVSIKGTAQSTSYTGGSAPKANAPGRNTAAADPTLPWASTSPGKTPASATAIAAPAFPGLTVPPSPGRSPGSARSTRSLFSLPWNAFGFGSGGTAASNGMPNPIIHADTFSSGSCVTSVISSPGRPAASRNQAVPSVAGTVSSFREIDRHEAEWGAALAAVRCKQLRAYLDGLAAIAACTLPGWRDEIAEAQRVTGQLLQLSPVK